MSFHIAFGHLTIKKYIVLDMWVIKDLLVKFMVLSLYFSLVDFTLLFI